MIEAPNGPELTRPASKDLYRAETERPAGRGGPIELLGGKLGSPASYWKAISSASST